MRLRIIGLVILVASGCSNNEKVTHSNEPTIRQYSNVHHPVKESTVALHEETRTGAAIGAAGYIFVVATERSTSKLEDTPVIASNADDAANKLSLVSSENAAIDAAKLVDKINKKSFSIYEMSRWERFCGHGKMDERDWAFVADQGRENLPESLKKECTEPTYTRQDYIDAWDAQCSDKDTEEYDLIRARTISPEITCKS